MFSFLSGFISSKEPQTQHIPESIPKHEPGSKQNKPQTDPQNLKHTLSGSESSENDLAIEIDVRERELVLKEPIFHNGYKYRHYYYSKTNKDNSYRCEKYRIPYGCKARVKLCHGSNAITEIEVYYHIKIDPYMSKGNI